jgi:hypothetical protein
MWLSARHFITGLFGIQQMWDRPISLRSLVLCVPIANNCRSISEGYPTPKPKPKNHAGVGGMSTASTWINHGPHTRNDKGLKKAKKKKKIGNDNLTLSSVKEIAG